MATSPNFSWPEPDNTDLVKNGALAIRTAVDAIDSSMADLKGGTTGQVLSKNSNTDMDFTWVAQDDSNAIQNAIVDAKGDLIAATAADTPARLAVGTNGQVLTADSTAATGLKWSAVTSKVVQIVTTTTSTGASSTSTSYADTNLTASITPTSASNSILVFVNHAGTRKGGGDTGVGLRLVRGSTTLATFETTAGFTGNTNFNQIGAASYMHLDSPATTSSTTYKTQFNNLNAAGTTVVQVDNAISSIVLMEVTP